MSSGRFWQITGGAGALGVAYYLYNAGGSPRLAEKKFEGAPTPHCISHCLPRALSHPASPY